MWCTFKDSLVYHPSHSLVWLLLVVLSGQLVTSTPYLDDSAGITIEDHHWEKPRNAIRGPCPVLNSLANHGYLPRSGQNITISQFRQGLDDSVNMHFLPRDTLVLVFYSLLGKQTEAGDPVKADPELLKQLINASSDGEWFTLQDLARLSNKRIKDSLKNNPKVSYDFRLKANSQVEMAALIDTFGKGKKVSKQTVIDLFVHERLPEDFKRSKVATLVPVISNFLELAIRSKILNPEI
ncbi:hypothetical protein K7432_004298 [Basidiobolus ranarum]|uniref:Heme haloperoxidase family profile domain-containing protein n=1 Tax=Basidiobolus ranarum TaxID=34480 RepID=A0ABR2WYE2_9FUNG